MRKILIELFHHNLNHNHEYFFFSDINECVNPGSCGINANCINLPGNFTCQCQEGYEGNPHDGCVDLNECEIPNVCGQDAICTNLEGSYRCDCPPGFDGDARSAEGCTDYDECARSPCGRDALCKNMIGSFRCDCPQGYIGDPMESCSGILFVAFNECFYFIKNKLINQINLPYNSNINLKFLTKKNN